jgi:hypothetical protein
MWWAHHPALVFLMFGQTPVGEQAHKELREGAETQGLLLATNSTLYGATGTGDEIRPFHLKPMGGSHLSAIKIFQQLSVIDLG